ncbi:MAG: glucokinase [Rhodanobacter sp.]
MLVGSPRTRKGDMVANPVTLVHDGATTRPFLVADVGGTHARIGLVSSQPEHGVPKLLACRTFRCGDHPHLEDIVRCFCAEFDVQPRELVLAAAGYLHAGVVINANLVWPIAPAAMGKTLGLDQVSFLNDFEALAYATVHLGAGNTTTLKAPQVPGSVVGPIVVIGPGTGLGAAVWFPGSPARVMATEAGQIQLAARSGLEQQLLARLAPACSHTPYEAVLSGPGLLRLYVALCAVRDRYPALDEPAAITAAALAGDDEMASETLTLFCGWLGSFAGDLALLYGATGGVCLAGGFLSRITDFMRGSPLVERFLDKGVMRPFLQKVPIRVVDHGQLGVMGAASWYLDVRVEGASNAGPASVSTAQVDETRHRA